MFRSLFLFCISIPTLLPAAGEQKSFRRPLVFEPNLGQAPAGVKWIGRASGYQLLLTNEGATIVVPESPTPAYAAIRMNLTGSKAWDEITGLEPTGGVSNYLFGNDPKQWRTGIPHYAKLSAKQVYEGIDLVFYSNSGDLEYDFVVAPGADPKQIRLAFDGVDEMRVDGKSGDLLLITAGGAELRHVCPKVYQQVGSERVEVAGGYEILDRRHATFTLAAYDRQRPLVIDPVIKFAKVLAGNDNEFAFALAIDSSGNAYATGETDSTNFPRAAAMQEDQPSTDAFVTKLTSSGAIVFSTYLGGNGTDEGWGIAVDSTGVYVSGWTNSTNFPIKNSFYPSRSADAFVTKLTLAGNSLVYSSYLGGTESDYAYGIAVDPEHGAWVVGSTESEDFPIVGGPNAGQQRMHGGDWDGFMARIAPDGLSVAYSTFVGGPSEDALQAVAVDRTGSVYTSGYGGYGFPITTGMKPCGSLADVVVVRLKGRGTQPRYATCLGPGDSWGIAVDTKFNAYATGYTHSANFPTTSGAFQRNKPTADPESSSGFVTKLGSSGAIAYSTYLGGKNGSTSGFDIAVDRGGAAYVVGETSATIFPGLPPLSPNSWNGFLAKLTPKGNGLQYSASFGSEIDDVSVFQPSATLPPQIYASGAKITAGTPTRKTDAFVIKWE